MNHQSINQSIASWYNKLFGINSIRVKKVPSSRSTQSFKRCCLFCSSGRALVLIDTRHRVQRTLQVLPRPKKPLKSTKNPRFSRFAGRAPFTYKRIWRFTSIMFVGYNQSVMIGYIQWWLNICKILLPIQLQSAGLGSVDIPTFFFLSFLLLVPSLKHGQVSTYLVGQRGLLTGNACCRWVRGAKEPVLEEKKKRGLKSACKTAQLGN